LFFSLCVAAWDCFISRADAGRRTSRNDDREHVAFHRSVEQFIRARKGRLKAPFGQNYLVKIVETVVGSVRERFMCRPRVMGAAEPNCLEVEIKHEVDKGLLVALLSGVACRTHR